MLRLDPIQARINLLVAIAQCDDEVEGATYWILTARREALKVKW